MILAGHDFEDRALVGRVMRNMKGISRYGTQRWVLVKNTFGVGCTVAYALCHEFGLNPDDILKK